MCPVMDAIDADCELIFVDDGSQDATLSEMKKLSEKDARCQYLSFSRNFGKEAAIYAGLCKAKGDYVVVMDVDLQDRRSFCRRCMRWSKTEPVTASPPDAPTEPGSR